MEFHRKNVANFLWTPHPSMPDHDAVVAHLNSVAILVQNVWDNDPKVTSSKLVTNISRRDDFYSFYPKVVCEGEGLTAADLDNNVEAAVTVLKARLNQPAFSDVRHHKHKSTGAVDEPLKADRS